MCIWAPVNRQHWFGFRKSICFLSKVGLLLQPHRGVEQLVARWAHNPKVTGSSPVPATKTNYKPLHINFCKGFCFLVDSTIRNLLENSNT